MDQADIARLRLRHQAIEGGGLAAPEDVVRRLGAMQAQDYQQALWAIGSRLTCGTKMAVEEAIAAGRILRTWPMRGTLHFVPAEDAHWMLALTTPRIVAGARTRRERLELDERTFGDAGEVLARELSGGKRLPRSRAMALLEEAGIHTGGQRGYHILWHLAQQGLVCIGPMEGREQTVVLLDEWVPATRRLSREEALAELAARYLAGHAPATIHDFAWWSGLTVGDARAAFASLDPKPHSLTADGTTYWLPQVGAESIDPDTRVHLLPGFDEYLLGYQDRRIPLPAEHANRVVPGNNGIFLPIVVIDGQVVGTWKRTIRKGTVSLQLDAFDPTGTVHDRLEPAITRYGRFLGMPATLERT